MTASKKPSIGSGKNRKNTGSKDKHWQSLMRDPKGRWIKKRKKSGKSIDTKLQIIKTPKEKQTHPKVIDKEEDAEILLGKIKHDFEEGCPRCSGEMQYFKVRCGPKRLVDVRKCTICNFWVPISTP